MKLTGRAAVALGTILVAIDSSSNAGDAKVRFEPHEFASAPLVENPRLIRLGIGGTAWVVDRRGDEDSIVLLRDTDGDGRADDASTLLEHLLFVRGVVPIDAHRALVLEPPHLFVADDTDGDGNAERFDVIAGGLDHGSGLALSADGLLHVTGANIRFRWDGSRLMGEYCDLASRAAAITDDGDRGVFVAIGPLVFRESRRSAIEPVGFTGDSLAPIDIAFSRVDGVIAISGDARSVARLRPATRVWCRSAVEGPDRIFVASATDGPLTSLDVASDGSIYVAIGATAPAKNDGRVVQLVARGKSQPTADIEGSMSWTSPETRETVAVDEYPVRASLATKDPSVARAVVEDALNNSDEPALDGLFAWLRLNDRRPGWLALDAPPRGFDVANVKQLDPTAQRIVRRLRWPGRADAAMDIEPPLTSAEVIERGRRLYSNCLTCHGARGRGQSGVYPPLAGSPYALGDAERFANIVLHGLEGPIEVGGRAFAGSMPPPLVSTDEDIAAVMTFVRQAFGNTADAVSKDVVARVRAATSARTKPWTAKELEALTIPR